ncbi:MAG: glycosyltransferase family 9 protein [bacterium]|nr:glycosyltransferase family 9 protein [bacterium]
MTRTDRLGDLVVSLPAAIHLKRAQPDWEVHFMVAPAALPLVENEPALDGLWTWSDDDSCDEAALAAALGRERFDAAVVLQYRRELALLLRRAGIRRRYGPWSRFSSWFLLNRGVRQARSRRDRHESRYSLDLVRGLAPAVPPDPEPARLRLSGEQQAAAAAFRAGPAAGADVVAFVHPGSGGSALDWAPENFVQVANGLARRPGWRVFLTGSGADVDRLAPVRDRLAPEVGNLQDSCELREFMSVLAAGDLFVGPSTGPLHMAAALDLAVVGLYPPVPTMAPVRWGPRGPWCETLVPDVTCPDRRTCRMTRCSLHNCLERITCENVIETAVAVAQRRRQGPPPPAATEEKT